MTYASPDVGPGPDVTWPEIFLCVLLSGSRIKSHCLAALCLLQSFISLCIVVINLREADLYTELFHCYREKFSADINCFFLFTSQSCVQCAVPFVYLQCIFVTLVLLFSHICSPLV